MEINRFICLDWRLFLVSRNSTNSGKAGVGTVNCNNDWTNDNANIATHLCLKFKNIFKYINPASWQNTKQSLIQFSRLILGKLEVK